MDSTQLISTEIVPPQVQLEEYHGLPARDTTAKMAVVRKFDALQEDKKKQTAKDFESILIYKLLEEMKNTIGDWGFEKDEASRQVQGIFWLYLARDIANDGGFGLWKDVYQLLTDSNKKV